MGFRFQRSLKLMPGVRLNFSKSGIGASFGVPGARYSISPTGRRTITTGLPGTGLSWRQSAGAVRLGSASSESDSRYAARMTRPSGPGCFSVSFTVFGALGVVGAVGNKPFNLASLLFWIGVTGVALWVVVSRSRRQAQFTGVEDVRATDGPERDQEMSAPPDTLEEILIEQHIYTPMWEAYKRAKAGLGGGLANGLPLEGNEVAIYELPGEFFDPSKGLDTIEGQVIVTNKRIIFDSVERSHEWPLAKLSKITVTGAGQRVFGVKGRSKNYGLLFADAVNHFDNAMGMALSLTNPRFTPGGSPEPLFEGYLAKLADKRAELEKGSGSSN